MLELRVGLPGQVCSPLVGHLGKPVPVAALPGDVAQHAVGEHGVEPRPALVGVLLGQRERLPAPLDRLVESAQFPGQPAPAGQDQVARRVARPRLLVEPVERLAGHVGVAAGSV